MPPSAIARYRLGSARSTSEPATPALRSPAATAQVCCRSGGSALAPTTTTNATSFERDAAIGDHPAALAESPEPDLRRVYARLGAQRGHGAERVVGQLRVGPLEERVPLRPLVVDQHGQTPAGELHRLAHQLRARRSGAGAVHQDHARPSGLRPGGQGRCRAWPGPRYRGSSPPSPSDQPERRAGTWYPPAGAVESTAGEGMLVAAVAAESPTGRCVGAAARQKARPAGVSRPQPPVWRAGTGRGPLPLGQESVSYRRTYSAEMSRQRSLCRYRSAGGLGCSS